LVVVDDDATSVVERCFEIEAVGVNGRLPRRRWLSAEMSYHKSYSENAWLKLTVSGLPPLKWQVRPEGTLCCPSFLSLGFNELESLLSFGTASRSVRQLPASPILMAPEKSTMITSTPGRLQTLPNETTTFPGNCCKSKAPENLTTCCSSIQSLWRHSGKA
jgi:hypothetical protein